MYSGEISLLESCHKGNEKQVVKLWGQWSLRVARKCLINATFSSSNYPLIWLAESLPMAIKSWQLKQKADVGEAMMYALVILRSLSRLSWPSVPITRVFEAKGRIILRIPWIHTNTCRVHGHDFECQHQLKPGGVSWRHHNLVIMLITTYTQEACFLYMHM